MKDLGGRIIHEKDTNFTNTFKLSQYTWIKNVHISKRQAFVFQLIWIEVLSKHKKPFSLTMYL